jgi:hypothetical protein
MSKKAWLLCGGCLIVGLVIGYFSAWFFARHTIVEALACRDWLMHDMGQHAMQAYHGKDSAVAIYALTSYVSSLQCSVDSEVDGYDPFRTSADVQVRLMFAHARLARLFAASGDAIASSNHLAEALRCRQASGRFQSVTNETELFKLLPELNQKRVP